MNTLSDLMFFLGFFLIAYILFHLHPMIVALFVVYYLRESSFH